MKPLLCLAALGLLAGVARAADQTPVDPVGWHWYNEAQEDDAATATPPPAAALTPSQQKAQLQRATKEALDAAILYPTPAHFRRYMTLQNFWTTKAGEFSQSAKQAMLLYPDLDYNLKYSHYNGTVKAQLAADRDKENAAISRLASRYGVFFFYRGAEVTDGQLGGVIKNFAREHGVSLIPVSVDGVLNPLFPGSRRDRGQSRNMGISHFPALFLVDPKDQTYRPLAYGFITQDDLARQFLDVATDFSPNF